MRLVALIATLVAASFFLQAEVEITDQRFQAFLKEEEIDDDYRRSGQVLPGIVRDTIRTYNARNRNDLMGAVNSTATEHPPSELCRDMPDLVKAVFPNADCGIATASLGGRGRYYERLLLRLNEDRGRPLSAGVLTDAISRMQSGEYLEGTCRAFNSGQSRADDVDMRAADPFKPRSERKPKLNPGASTTARFHTDEFLSRDPVLRCDVTFDTGKGWVNPTYFKAVVVLAIVSAVVSLILLLTGRIGP